MLEVLFVRQEILFSLMHVEDTLKSDKHLHAARRTLCPVHVTICLKREYARELKENDLGMMTSSTLSSAVDSEGKVRPTVVKKH